MESAQNPLRNHHMMRDIKHLPVPKKIGLVPQKAQSFVLPLEMSTDVVKILAKHCKKEFPSSGTSLPTCCFVRSSMARAKRKKPRAKGCLAARSSPYPTHVFWVCERFMPLLCCLPQDLPGNGRISNFLIDELIGPSGPEKESANPEEVEEWRNLREFASQKKVVLGE